LQSHKSHIYSRDCKDTLVLVISLFISAEKKSEKKDERDFRSADAKETSHAGGFMKTVNLIIRKLKNFFRLSRQKNQDIRKKETKEKKD
jgi:hypothetical protein